MAEKIIPINKTSGMLAHAADDYEDKINELVVMVNDFLVEAKSDIIALSDANKLSLESMQGSETAFIDSFNALVDTVNATVTKVNTFLKESEETVREFTADELNDTNTLQAIFEKLNSLVATNNTLSGKITEAIALGGNNVAKHNALKQEVDKLKSRVDLLQNQGEEPVALSDLVKDVTKFSVKILNRGRSKKLKKVNLGNILLVDRVLLHLTIEFVFTRDWQYADFYISDRNDMNYSFHYGQNGRRGDIIKLPISMITEKKELYYCIYSNKFGYVNIHIDSVEAVK